MKITIEGVSPCLNGAWISQIDPQNLLKLAKPLRQGGQKSILLVSRPQFDPQNHSLHFNIGSALLLNLGKTFEVVLVDAGDSDTRLSSPESQHRTSMPPGDLLFMEELNRLPSQQKELGQQLLEEVRKEFPGELVFHQKSGKFVESPDNFWVIRIQPRSQSLRIIVYGTPQEHGTPKRFQLKDDMKSYSNFVINNARQLSEAVTTIREAKRLKDMR